MQKHIQLCLCKERSRPLLVLDVYCSFLKNPKGFRSAAKEIMKKYPSLSNLIVKLIIPVGLQNGFVMNILRPQVRQVSAEENTTNVDWMMMDVSVNNGDTD